jgi:hypothetical protein
MTCQVLGQSSAFYIGRPVAHRCLKAASRHRPIAIDPEGLTVRVHCFSVNNPG